MKRSKFSAVVSLLATGLTASVGAYIIMNSGSQSSMVNALPRRSGTLTGAAPTIASAGLSGRKLIVTGENFDDGAEILVNGVRRKTSNGAESPATTLISKKAGMGMELGQIVKLQVQNSDGQLSGELSFYTGCGES